MSGSRNGSLSRCGSALSTPRKSMNKSEKADLTPYKKSPRVNSAGSFRSQGLKRDTSNASLNSSCLSSASRKRYNVALGRDKPKPQLAASRPNTTGSALKK